MLACAHAADARQQRSPQCTRQARVRVRVDVQPLPGLACGHRLPAAAVSITQVDADREKDVKYLRKQPAGLNQDAARQPWKRLHIHHAAAGRAARARHHAGRCQRLVKCVWQSRLLEKALLAGAPRSGKHRGASARAAHRPCSRSRRPCCSAAPLPRPPLASVLVPLCT